MLFPLEILGREIKKKKKRQGREMGSEKIKIGTRHLLPTGAVKWKKNTN